MSGILELENALQTAIPILSDAQITERRTREVNMSSSYLDILSRKVEWKLKTSFLRKFMVLENQFRSLLPPNVVKDEFWDFLMEKYDLVKDMNEAQFMQCLINEKSSAYSHFVRYLRWLMS